MISGDIDRKLKNFLTDVLLTLDSYRDLIEDINRKKSVISLNGIIEEGLGHFIYSIDFHCPGKKIIISYDENRAQKIYDDLRNFGAKDVYYFPKKEDFFYNSIGRSLDSQNKQIEAMWNLINKDAIIVTTIEACQNKIMSRGIFNGNSYRIDLSDEIEIQALSELLVEFGYENVYSVEGKGQFSVRGGIIDIFVPINNYPYRIEFFDREIDSIRIFDPISQRSIEQCDSVEISPAMENILSQDMSESLIKAIEKDLKSIKIKDQHILDRMEFKYGKIIDRLKSNLHIRNLDLLIPYMPEEKLASIVEYGDKDTLYIIDEPRRIEEKIDNNLKDFKLKFSDLLLAGEVFYSHEKSFFTYEEIIRKIDKKTKITFSNILRDNKYLKPQSIINFRMKSTTSYNGRMDIFNEEILRYQYRGYKIAILAEGEERIARLQESLEELGIYATRVESPNCDIKSGQVFLFESSMGRGFEYSDIKFLLISHREIYGKIKKDRAKKKRSPQGITDFSDIELGSYVVHENHGVGIYQGTEQLEIQGNIRDFILIQYRGADRLYIPTDQLGLLHKYSGTKDAKPKIHKLDSAEWNRAKQRAKGSIDDMADELIKLYAVRETKEGYKFSKDTLWQGEFEDAFPYQETDGQLKSIMEIKNDMESQAPMDRLLCADVGYGKTEVALRAAFKAVMDGKQVAFLVPTTILAQQHYNTMMERFRDFPVNVAILSRFRSGKEIKVDLKRLKRGEVDIVVGTHRLLSKDVLFKDLGLLIIDEEQRFGVRHKETLKMMKENVDTLTLTATPIPRTLQMSMAGIRNMSVIEEPPEERFPVQTYVAEFNPGMIREAILREIDRGGQVYFLYNRISDIESIASKIKELVPEARVSVAHGQMNERKLEETFISFLNQESDVLVCTTIIETGLDIPNTNTIIVYNADHFGLSQLYQLRGRVGRSNRIAYAYLTYMRDRQLSEVSEKRLMAIKEFTEFGSGYKIAMRDLEIRGAGDVLGSQQHGHINSIGYDMYLSYLETAMRKLKGEEVKDVNKTTIDINIEAYIPESYIEDENQRLEFYKKISLIENDEDYSDLIEEAIDRYGDIPESVNNLIDISHIKFLANDRGIELVSGSEDAIKFKFFDNVEIELSNFNEMISNYGSRISFNFTGEKEFIYSPKKYPLLEVKDLLENII